MKHSKEKKQKIHIEVLDKQMVAILKAKTPQQRLAITFGMWCAAKKELTYYLRSQHKDWSEEQIFMEVAKRLSHGSI